MKRILSLTFAFILCLGLAACGGNNILDTNDEPKQEVESQIETIIFGASESIYADHPYLEGVYGTWEFKENFSSYEYKMYKTLTINEDGTCVIDGENANWKIADGDTKDDSLYIDIYQNAKNICAACFFMDTKHGLVLWPVYRSDDGLPSQPNNYVLFEKNEF